MLRQTTLFLTEDQYGNMAFLDFDPLNLGKMMSWT